MSKHDKEKLHREEEKQKIRERYNEAIEPESILFKDDTAEKRVAVYCRTAVVDRFTTTTSNELLKAQYECIIAEHKNWTLVDFYFDEGISDALTKNNESLMRLIDDATNGEIDMILTKSITRMTGDIKELLALVIKLRRLNPPVGVYFEAEGFYTLDENKDMCLSAVAAFAEEESYLKCLTMRS